MTPTRYELNSLVRGILLASLAAQGPAVLAAPTGGNVQQGSATIQQQGAHTQIDQSSTSAEIDWDSFDLSSEESVTFSLPSSNGYTLNNIHGASPSTIHGQINSNGTVILANPNGLFFGAQSQVNVQSLVATTADVSMSANELTLSANEAAAGIVHQGQIKADSSVAFYAPRLTVSGTIESQDIRLSNHSTGVITLLESGIGFEVNDAADAQLRQQGIDLSGELISDGGYIEITTAARDTLANSAVNISGLVSASSLVSDGGTVSLVADEGTAWISGDLRADSNVEHGGDIEINADKIALVDKASVTASGASGGGSVRIGVGREQALARASKVYIGADALVEASATNTGDGGRIDVWSADQTRIYGTLKADGAGSGQQGGFIETSSEKQLIVDGDVSVTSPDGESGEWLLDPGDIYIGAAPNIDIIENPSGVFNSTDDTDDSFLSLTSLQIALILNNNVVIESTGVDSDVIFMEGSNLNLGLAGTGSSLTVIAVSDILVLSNIYNGISNGFDLSLNAGQDIYFYNGQLQASNIEIDAENVYSNNIFSGNSLIVDAVNVSLSDGLVWESSLSKTLVFTGGIQSLSGTAGVLTFEMNNQDLTLDSVNAMGSLSLNDVNVLYLSDTINTSAELDLESGVGSIELLDSILLGTAGAPILLADVTGNNHNLTITSASSATQDVTLNDILNVDDLTVETEGVLTLNNGDISINGALLFDAGTVQLSSINTIEAGGEIFIGSPIEGSSIGNTELSLNAGTVTDSNLLLGTMGATQRINDVDLEASGTVFLDSLVNVGFLYVYNAGGSASISVNDDFTLLAPNQANFNGASFESINQGVVTLNAGNMYGLGSVEAGRLVVDTNNLFLEGDLIAGSGGIDLSDVSSMFLNSDVEMSVSSTGDLSLPSNISGQYDLGLTVAGGDLSLGTQNGSAILASLTVTDTDLTSGVNTVGEQIRVLSGLDLSDLGSLSSSTGLALTSDNGSVTLSGTQLESTADQSLTLSAANGTLALGDVSAGEVIVSSNETRLNGDIVAAGLLDLSLASQIVLDGDSRLTGELTLGTVANPVSINSAAGGPGYSLSLDVLNRDLTLFEVGATDALSSFSLVNAGTLQLTETINTRGNGGITLSGAQWILTDDITFDTSLGNGQIDLKDIAINGPQTLTLNAGNGRIALGDIGQDSVLTSLVLDRVSALELGGDITTEDTILDFSMAQTIELVGNTQLDVSEQDGAINLGAAAINGTFDLQLNSGAGTVQLGSVGQTVALQSLGISTTSDLVMDHAVSVVDELQLSGLSLALNDVLDSSGGLITLAGAEGITMAADSRLNGYEGVNLSAAAGDVRLARVASDQGGIQVTATEGSILNGIGDFVSITDTSINLTANNVDLVAGSGIGVSPVDPLVLDVDQQGEINLTFGEPYAYIVNINGSAVNAFGGEVFDTLQESQSAVSQQIAGLQKFDRLGVPVTGQPNADNENERLMFAITQPGFVIPSNLLMDIGELSDNRPAVPALRWLNGRWQLQYPVGTRQ